MKTARRQMSAKEKRIRLIIYTVIGVLMFAAAVFVIYEDNHLVVKNFEYKNNKVPEEFDGYRIVQISDVHDKSFGKNNKKLILAVEELDPDIIVITGDIIDTERSRIEKAGNLVKNLSGIAPVYYVSGNHEDDYLSEDKYNELMKVLADSGAYVFNESKQIEIEKGNDEIILCGLKDKDLLKTDIKMPEDSLNILLAHEPQWLRRYNEMNADVVFSGHTHAGQIALPGGKAIFAPGQGLFPEYSEGVYNYGNVTLYLNGGLGTAGPPVRFFTNPEIFCVRLGR